MPTKDKYICMALSLSDGADEIQADHQCILRQICEALKNNGYWSTFTEVNNVTFHLPSWANLFATYSEINFYKMCQTYGHMTHPACKWVPNLQQVC